jgi:hypothetical protein
MTTSSRSALPGLPDDVAFRADSLVGQTVEPASALEAAFDDGAFARDRLLGESEVARPADEDTSWCDPAPDRQADPLT